MFINQYTLGCRYMSLSEKSSDTSLLPLVGDAPASDGTPKLNWPSSAPVGRDRLAKAIASVAAIEYVLVFCTSYLASLVYNEAVLSRSPPSHEYVPAALFIATVILLTSVGFRHFAAIHSPTRRRFVWHGVAAVILSFCLFLSAMFSFKVANVYSRGTFLVQLVTVVVAVAAFRALALKLIHSAIAKGYLEAARVVFVGDQTLCASITDHLTREGFQTVRSFDFPTRHGGRRAGFDDEIDLRKVRSVIAECRILQPDDIIIVPADIQVGKAAQLAAALSELPSSIHLLPLAAMGLLPTARLGELGTRVTIELISRPLSLIDRAMKRAFDITVAVVSLLLLSPLLLIIAAAIKLDSPGPVLFRQTRHGYNNNPIQVFKFRSMTVIEDGDAFKQATKSDPRVTRIGQMLRRVNADELPQLFNVFLGDMSIVGPRPHPIALNEQYQGRIPPFRRRHNIKPGITGWAQINGFRGETDTLEKMQQRVEYDLYYIDNWSFLFDIQILVLTLLSSKAYSNAY